VRPGEGTTALLLFANVYLILCAYYFVKPLRDGWIATSPIEGLSKMEVRAYTSFAQGVVLIGAMALYARLAGRWSRGALVVRTTLFCALNLVGFWLVRPGSGFDGPAIGIAFYVWVGMFGVFVVAQFWAFAADLYTDERGKRLLPLVAIGATAGAATGSFLTGKLLATGLVDSSSLLLLANVPLAAAIALTLRVDARGPTGEGADPAASARAAAPAAPADGAGLLVLLRRHGFLAAVAVVTLLVHWVGTNGENVLFRVVQETLEQQISATLAPEAASAFVRDGTTAFYGRFFFGVNATALVLQSLVASRLLKYGGFGLVLLFLPVVALLGNAAMAFAPLLPVMRWLKTAENASNYSVQNTATHVFWLPTSAALKYQAKPAIETLCVRVGDGLAALTVLLGVNFFAFETRSFLLVNVALVALWLTAALYVLRAHRRLVAGA
jgi:AAA family ATP:ADP antiporter